MSIILLEDIPYTLDFGAVCKRLHIAEEAEEIERVAEILNEVRTVARPKAAFKAAYIDSKGTNSVMIEGIEFHSRILRSNFDSIHRVFPFIATCGSEVEEYSEKLDDFLEKYWLDSIKELLLGAAIGFLSEKIKSTFALNGISTMNPGSLEDWPLSGQIPLFSLLGNTRDSLGVTLTDSLLMIPSKTVSGIYFPTESNYENCRLCPRESCTGRRVPFDEELHREKLG